MTELTFGPPKAYTLVSVKEYGTYPMVCRYQECNPEDKTPRLLEIMTMQKYLREAINKYDTLWNREQILLQIGEELGELIQAFRKKTRGDVLDEFGDVMFAVLALAEREGIDAREELCKAVNRYEERQLKSKEKYCDACGGLLTFATVKEGYRLCIDCHLTRKALAGN